MLARRPFLKSLVKLFAKITVGWAAVSFCLALTFGTVAVIGGIFMYSTSQPLSDQQHVGGNAGASHKLLSISISGVLDGQSPDDPTKKDPTMVYGYDIKQQLYDAAKDQTFDGVVLEIDSPGGAIFGAQAIADGVKHFKDATHKPVFAHVAGMAASGAYWAAISTDRIIADTGTSTGSIGVIEGPFMYYDKVLAQSDQAGTVVTQNGIASTTISAGRGKDEGDPFVHLSPEETANMQAGVNNEYATFVSYVAAQRHISDATIRNQIGAMTYDTKTALGFNLIDAVGSREDAFSALAKAANINGDDYEVVRANPQPSSALPGLASAAKAQANPPKSASNLCRSRSAKAYYGDLAALCATK